MWKKIVEFLKKFWWLILAIAAFVLGTTLKSHKPKPSLDQNKQLEQEQAELEQKLQELKKQEQQIQSQKKFDNQQDAADYINKLFKK